MPRTERFSDITQRLTLFERFFGIKTLKNWLEILPYDSPGSISRVRRGEIGINYEAIDAICNAAGISNKQFRAPLLELSEVLDVTDEAGVEEMLAGLSEGVEEISGALFRGDLDIINAIPGHYIFLYSGREDLNFDRKHILIEKFKIRPSSDRKTCEIIQTSNIVTGETATGSLTSIASRVAFWLPYKKSYFVNSQFLMSPIYLGGDIRIFFGIYLDVAPMDQNQVFATLFCMFNVDDLRKYPKRWTTGDEEFDLWIDILCAKGVDDRGRLIVDPSGEFSERVRRAVQATVAKEGS